MSDLPVAFADRVKAKINESITNLLPEEDVSALVDAQLQHFLREDLPEMVKEAIRADMAKRITEQLNSLAYQQKYVDGNFQASDLVKKIMVENANEVFVSMFSNMAQMLVSNMRNQRLI